MNYPTNNNRCLWQVQIFQWGVGKKGGRRAEAGSHDALFIQILHSVHSQHCPTGSWKLPLFLFSHLIWLSWCLLLWQKTGLHFVQEKPPEFLFKWYFSPYINLYLLILRTGKILQCKHTVAVELLAPFGSTQLLWDFLRIIAKKICLL